LVGVQEINFDLNGKKLTVAPLLDALEASPMYRQINAAFAFDPKNPPRWMLEEANSEVTAFSLPVPLVVDQPRREILQRDIDAVLRAMLEQERRHEFHGYASPAAVDTAFHIEIIDSDNAAIVRANCDTKRAQVSTGYIRRLLERSIAAAGAEEKFGIEKSSFWVTSREGNWPPSLTNLITTWQGVVDFEGITLTGTVKRMLLMEGRLQTEVAPEIDKSLAKMNLPSDRDTFADISAEGDATTLEVAERLAELAGLSGAPRRVLDELSAESNRMMAAYENKPTSRVAKDLEQLEQEADLFAGGPVMNTTMDTFVLARFAQEQYLKALAFIVAHEAAHLWMDGCVQSNENENRADAYAVLVSFELFHNHQSRVKIASNGVLMIPKPDIPEDDTPMSEWMAESLGWSGFDLVAETFGKAGIAPDSSHDDFDTRSGLVRDVYLDLVKSVMKRVDSTEERTNEQ
jgi:hypothetical protein